MIMDLIRVSSPRSRTASLRVSTFREPEKKAELHSFRVWPDSTWSLANSFVISVIWHWGDWNILSIFKAAWGMGLRVSMVLKISSMEGATKVFFDLPLSIQAGWMAVSPVVIFNSREQEENPPVSDLMTLIPAFSRMARAMSVDLPPMSRPTSWRLTGTTRAPPAIQD